MGRFRGDSSGLTIGAAAKAVGTTPRAIRLYEDRGLMPRPAREPGNRYRRYQDADLQRLRFIKRAQTLGFSLTDIGELLVLDDGDCDIVQRLAGRHLDEVRSRIAELEWLRSGLEQLLASCTHSGDRGCPVLSALAAESSSS